MDKTLTLVASFFFLLLFSNTVTAKRDNVTLPVIPDKQVPMSVAYVENPQFASLTTKDLEKVLESAKGFVKDHFQIRIDFLKPIKHYDIDPLFKDLKKQAPEFFFDLIADFRKGAVDWSKVRESLIEQIKKQKEPLTDQIAYAKPYLLSPVTKQTAESFADAVTDTFKQRLKYWTTAKKKNGVPILGPYKNRPILPLNEYGYWSLMAREGFHSDIILTNQLVASVEYMPIPVHTSLRGGITGGSTEYNPKARFGSSVWVSLYPFLSDDPNIQRLRNNKTFTRGKALDYAGAMLAHEIGHQLLHLGHPWGNTACIMTPLKVLDIENWIKNLNPKKCPIGSSPAMKPGAVDIPIW